MATKTFEELKQLAIQIRDEKTNKQNTATRIGTQMLEHLDKLEQDYYDKTATDEELKERDEKLIELEGKSITESVQDYPDDITVTGGSSTSATSLGFINVFSGQYVYIKIQRTQGVNTNTAFYVGSYSKTLDFDENNIAEAYVKIVNGGKLQAQLYQRLNSDKGVYTLLSFKYKYASEFVGELNEELKEYKEQNDKDIIGIEESIEPPFTDSPFVKTSTKYEQFSSWIVAARFNLDESLKLSPTVSQKVIAYIKIEIYQTDVSPWIKQGEFFYYGDQTLETPQKVVSDIGELWIIPAKIITGSSVTYEMAGFKKEIFNKTSNKIRFEQGLIDTAESKKVTDNTKIDICKLGNLIEGSYITLGGTESTSTLTKRTDYLEISGKFVKAIEWNGDLTKNPSNVSFVAFFDKNKNFISNDQTRSKEISVPLETEYIVISYFTSVDFPNVFIYPNGYIYSNSNEKTESVFCIPKYIDVVVNKRANFFTDGITYEADAYNDLIFPLVNGTTQMFLEGKIISILETTANEKTIRFTRVSDKSKSIEEKTVTIRSVVPNGGGGSTKNILFVGDSLIEAGYAVSQAYTLLSSDGDVVINEIGTINRGGAKHEGKGGWKWSNFISSGSPFYIDGEVNFQKYMANNFPELGGIDYVIVSLGTNDVTSDSFLTNKELNAIIDNAKVFIDAFFSSDTGFPNAKIAVGLPGFCSMNRKNGKTILTKYNLGRLNQMYIETFDNGIYNSNVTTVMHGAHIDRHNGYTFTEENLDDLFPTVKYVKYTDDVHPNENGYRQWGNAYYAKLRAFINGKL